MDSSISWVFTPKRLPPSTISLWNMPENQITSLCLPEEKNNAMFIPEPPTNRAGLPVKQDFQAATALDVEQLFENHDPPEVQSRYRAVDAWLEYNCIQDSYSYHLRSQPSFQNHQADQPTTLIPHHLLAQLGLAGHSAPAANQETVQSQKSNTGNKVWISTNYRRSMGECQADPRQSAHCRSPVECIANGFPSEIECYEKGSQLSNPQSSLSQLFQNKEPEDNEREELEQSLETMNHNSDRNTKHFRSNVETAALPHEQAEILDERIHPNIQESVDMINGNASKVHCIKHLPDFRMHTSKSKDAIGIGSAQTEIPEQLSHLEKGLGDDITQEEDDKCLNERDDTVNGASQSSLSQLFQTQEFNQENYTEFLMLCVAPTGKSMIQKDYGAAHGRQDGSQSGHLNSDGRNDRDNAGDMRMNNTVTVIMNAQPFVMRGAEPRMFNTSIEHKGDQPWKDDVWQGIIEPTVGISKRDEVQLDEIPMIVSPYFPNENNYPVQDDKRTTLTAVAENFFSCAEKATDNEPSQNVVEKVLSYERETDEYQVCKHFFSLPSPKALKSHNKARDKDVRDGPPKAKKTKNAEITRYFPVVKKHDSLSKHREKQMHPRSSCSQLEYDERHMTKFKFGDLPKTDEHKMANFYAPVSGGLTQRVDGRFDKKLAPLDAKNEKYAFSDLPPGNVNSMSQLMSTGVRMTESPSLQHCENDSQPQGQFFQTKDYLRMNEKFEIILLEESKVEKVAFLMESSGELVEIGFTICYSGKYSRLNKPENMQGTQAKLAGIMSRAEFIGLKTLLIYQDMKGLGEEKGQSFLLRLLESKCRKVCFEAQAFVQLVLDILQDPNKRISYDWRLMDPMVATWLLDPDNPTNSFGQILERLNLKIIKKEHPLNWTETVSVYLEAQSNAMEKLYSQLVPLCLWDVFFNMETPLIPILAAMESRKIEVNYHKLRETSNILEEKLRAVEQEAWKVVGKSFQLSSPIQLRKILYDELKLDEMGSVEVKSTAALGAKSTDEGTLKMLAGLHPLPKLVLEHRHLHKIKSTYIDGLLAHVVQQKYVSTSWEHCSTATGRITSSQPNLQSVPKQEQDISTGNEKFSVRMMFISRNGYKFIGVDFEQIEMRIFANLSQDHGLVSAFKQSEDIFKTMTRIRLGTHSFDSSQREITKTLVYALLYGAGARKISELLSVDFETANELCSNFYAQFPSLKTYRSRVLQECQARKELRSLSGRRRLFPNIVKSSLQQKRYRERQAVNFTIQGVPVQRLGSAADICKAAMLRVEKALRKHEINASLILQIHDELIWEVLEQEEHRAIEAIKEAMEDTTDYWLRKFKMNLELPVRVTSGYSWGRMS